jgi:hypothetical protein
MAEEYTPSEGDIRGRHAAGWLSRGWPETTEIDAEFDRWLATHDARVRREAKVEVLREARVSIRAVLDDTPLLRGLVGINGGAQAMRDFYDESLTEIADRIEREGGEG